MELQEFEEVINDAENKLEVKRGSGFIYDGVCDSLYLSLEKSEEWDDRDTRVDRVFVSLFKPFSPYYTSYWLGELNKSNLELRKTALRLFERVSIDREYYLEY